MWYKSFSAYYSKILSLLTMLLSIGNIILGGLVAITIISSLGSLLNRHIYVGDHTITAHQVLNDVGYCDPLKVTLKECVIDDKGNIYISYISSMKPFSNGWSMLDFKISDDLGNIYYGGASSYGSIFGAYHQITIDDMHSGAKKLILEYDHYNRYMRFEIDLQEVRGNV